MYKNICQKNEHDSVDVLFEKFAEFDHRARMHRYPPRIRGSVKVKTLRKQIASMQKIVG